ncbi:hypothetical protein IE53DRAFT_266813 [Violaceomyces palustris]|uniref:Uncharacterized protein n=1 Tax=Violaceomyces palustris TaxID=1673888 RepID=A0ACD0NMV7_9BASI|nr:hypothetical protein IE53DRAFT_266813 [Violaceomyces palustris]
MLCFPFKSVSMRGPSSRKSSTSSSLGGQPLPIHRLSTGNLKNIRNPSIDPNWTPESLQTKRKHSHSLRPSGQLKLGSALLETFHEVWKESRCERRRITRAKGAKGGEGENGKEGIDTSHHPSNLPGPLALADFGKEESSRPLEPRTYSTVLDRGSDEQRIEGG